MAEILSSNAAAERLGISSSRVRRLARTYNIGTKVSERSWVFTSADIAKLARVSTGKSGRPSQAAVAGNEPDGEGA